MFDRDEQEISQIIETGVKAIRSGKVTLEQFLAQHPDMADEIRPEIAAALWLIASQREVESRPGFVTSSRKRVLERIKAEAREQDKKRSFFGIIWPRQIALQWVVAAVLLVVVLTGAGGVVSFSQAALPGDGLYAVKRASEQVAYTVTLNDVQRVQLSAQYTERRLDEVETLMSKGSFTQAGKALNAFNQQVTQTVTLLQNVSDTQPMSKLTAAVTLREQLSDQADRLNVLMTSASAPPDLRLSLENAKDTANLSAAATTTVIKDIPAATLTQFPTFTGTNFVIETPVPSGTPEPSVPTVEPSDEPSALGTPEPGTDGTPGVTTPGAPSSLSVGTKVPTQKPSKTAKPDVSPKTQPSPVVDNNKGGNTDNGNNNNNNNNNDNNNSSDKEPPGKNK